MKNVTSKLIGISAGLLLITASTAANSQEVDTDTSDTKLLKGIDKSEMFEVVRPSTRLEFHLEGVKYPIDVRYLKNATVLYVEDSSEAEQERILEAFKKMTNSENVTVKNKESLVRTESE